MARVGRGLRGFFHPAARYEIAWDIARTPLQRDDLDVVPDDGRAVVAAVLDRFDEPVAPVLGGLRGEVVRPVFRRFNAVELDA